MWRTPLSLETLAAGAFALATAASIAARLAVSRDHAPTDLVMQALDWREQAQAATDDVLRLQHYSMALALLHAARGLASDAELERASRADVARLTRSMETKAARARVSLRRHVHQAADGAPTSSA